MAPATRTKRRAPRNAVSSEDRGVEDGDWKGRRLRREMTVNSLWTKPKKKGGQS